MPLGKLFLAALVSIAATPAEHHDGAVVARSPELLDPDVTETVCRDRIHEARAANGQPELRRETAQPDAPLFIAAVDQRIDGCNVMVMRNDTSDIRPLPKPDGSGEWIPAR